MKKLFLFMTFMMGCTLSSWAQTATDSYLDIANYASMEGNYTKFTLNNIGGVEYLNLYKYTEYPDDGVAWLTMPVYLAARSAGSQNNQNLNWITVGSNTIYGYSATGDGQKWLAKSSATRGTNPNRSATSPIWGSNEYYGTGGAYKYGNANNGEWVAFYVTNVTQIQMYLNWFKNTTATENNGVMIEIYKCKSAIDLTLESQPVRELFHGSSAGSTTYTTTEGVLKASDVYKVVCTCKKGCVSEIAFRTPLDLGGYDVVISEAGVSTLYLDYPVSIPYDEYDDVTDVYYIQGIDSDGKKLKAQRLDNIIPANTGVIIEGNSNTDEDPYFFPRITENQAASYAENSVTSKLEGSTTEIPVSTVEALNPGKIVYTLGRRKSAIAANFYKYKGTTLAANKAYLLVDASNSAKSFTLNFDGDATGINTVDANSVDGAWYNLQGIQIQGQPTSKGVFIHNGKKVVVK